MKNGILSPLSKLIVIGPDGGVYLNAEQQILISHERPIVVLIQEHSQLFGGNRYILSLGGEVTITNRFTHLLFTENTTNK